MDVLTKHNLTPLKVLKISGVVLLGLIVISIAFSFLNIMGGGLGLTSTDSEGISLSAPGFGGSYDAMEMAVEDFDRAAVKSGLPAPLPNPTPTPGNDGEDYEVTEYRGSIETKDSNSACSAIATLKSREDVIFENANESDTGCNYTFKVANESAADVLSVIESLNPKDLNENTHTIKRVLDNYTSEVDILESKLATIDKTLADSNAAYDEITQLARSTKDAESLAVAIDGKIKMLERLSQQRLQVVAQLERISRAKADQLDRLSYTYFYINVYENKFVDTKALKDSWKAEIRNFVWNTNAVFQGVTTGFGVLLLKVVQYGLYFFVLLFVAKLGWTLTKRIWNDSK